MIEILLGVVIVMTVMILMLSYMWLEGRKNKVVYSELSFASFPKNLSGMKIFFISDIHKRIISEDIMKEIREKADIIIIGGDLMEAGVPFERVQRNVNSLCKIAPTYFVWGNNDYEEDHLKLEAILKKEGVYILENESILISKGEEKVFLAGVDDVGHHFDDLEKAIRHAEGGFLILISHNPSIKLQIRNNHKINLILSGHTHGGQIRFLGFGLEKKGRLSEVKKDMFMLISNGYGTTTIPLRLGAPAETHLITLKSK